MRRLTDLAIAGTLVALGLVAGLSLVDVTNRPVVVLQTAGPFVVLGLLLLLLATLLLRRWWMLVPVGLAVAVAAVVAVPAFLSDASPGADRDITVMAANLRLGQADAGQLMAAVRDRGVDVLVLTEVTPAEVALLDAEGADSYFTAREGEAEVDLATGTLVWSRYPLSPVDAGDDVSLEGTANRQPEVAVSVSGGRVRLKAVHATSPLAETMEQWRASLAALQGWRERQPAGEAFLMAGDFNSSAGHPAFRALADGTVDAQRAAGQGWVRTWPFVGQRLPAYVQLDHLLSRGLTLVEAGQVALHGTDHAAVWASYALDDAPSR